MQPKDLPELDLSELEFNDPPTMVWIRVRDAIRYLWTENPKIHDLQKIEASIARHGFQEMPKFDRHLEPVTTGLEGAIKSGNGRIEALNEMEKHGAYELPRGLAKEKGTGNWCIPLIIGTDAASRAMARAYAIDANNLTMAGLSPEQQAKVWEPGGYLNLIQSALDDDALPVSLDETEARGLLDALAPDDGESEPEPEYTISPELLERHDYIVIYFDNELDWNVALDLFDLQKVETAPVKGKTLRQKGLCRVLPASKLYTVMGINPTEEQPT